VNKVKTYFEKERKRDHYAIRGKIKQFLETYRSEVELKNANTKAFWSRRIIQEYASLPASPVYKHKINLAADFLTNIKGKILDAGFGYGHLERKISKNKNIQIYGVDISDSAVKRIRKEIKGDFRTGDILALPHKSSFFDCIFALDVLEHIPPHKVFRAYRELYRVLKKGGYLVVSVPLNEGLEEKIRKGENPGAHLREYTANIIRMEMKVSKFKVFKEDFLYAFEKNYALKNLILKLSPIKLRDPNQIILYSQKT